MAKMGGAGKISKAGVVGIDAIDEVMSAMRLYHADVPVISTNTLVNQDVIKLRGTLYAQNGVNLQIWDRPMLQKQFDRLPVNSGKRKEPRPYQEQAIQDIVGRFEAGQNRSGLVILATGLGKTFVAGESIRRLQSGSAKVGKILFLAHTNELVYQLEKSIHPFLNKNVSTAVWNGNEFGDVENVRITFACIASVANYIKKNEFLPAQYDLIIIDEAHHAGSLTYREFLEFTIAGKKNGPLLLGLTATPGARMSTM